MDVNSIWNWFAGALGSIPCGYENWQKIWGDPILTGTVFMLCYGVAGVLAVKIARRAAGRERVLWYLSAFVFFFQVINTHLDLHAFIVSYGRCLAHAQGWYDVRRDVQYTMLFSAVVVMAFLISIAMFYFRRNLKQNFALIISVAIVLGITASKGINYHNLEVYYSGKFGPFRGADLIELSGIAIAVLAALLRIKQGSLER